jgi:Tfp pilus assembly protein PilO
MRSNERNILFVVGGLVLVAAFWLLIIGPKQKEASDLGQKVDDLQASVDQANQQVVFAKQAQRDFPANYGKLVVLGKAVPENADSASYLVQLNHLAKDSKVDFRGIELDDTDAGAAPAPAPTQPGINNAPPSTSQPSTDQPGAQTASNTGTSGTTDTASPAAAPATEASASSLAIGSSVGPAGLTTLKYKLHFAGDFFQIADFVKGVDKLIATSNGKVVVDGRLTTIDGFALGPDQTKGFPHLIGSFTVTTYLTPPAQGLTGGASPSGPAPTIPGQEPLQTASAPGGTP